MVSIDGGENAFGKTKPRKCALVYMRLQRIRNREKFVGHVHNETIAEKLVVIHTQVSSSNSSSNVIIGVIAFASVVLLIDIAGVIVTFVCAKW